MITYFVVQSFSVGKKGVVIPDLPAQAPSKDQAMKTAERLSHTKKAVIAFSRTGDSQTGDYEPAVVLCVFGEVPEEAEEALAAA